MNRGIYECVKCGYREIKDSTEPLIEKACPKCGGDMVLVGFDTMSEMQEPGIGEDNILINKLGEFYVMEPYKREGDVIVFKIHQIRENNFKIVLKELEKLGYWAALKKKDKDGEIFLYVFPAQPPKEENPWIGILLFITTVFTTLLAGYMLSTGYIATLDKYGLPGIRNPYLNAAAFSISILTILGTHEMGHKIAATYHGIRSTFPYFIPFPNILGTLGAVIRVKSPIPTRDAAIDLGVSGPLAGFLVAVPVTLIGLRLSIQVPASWVTQTAGGIYFGENLFFIILEKYVMHIPNDAVLFLHPVAIAGWIGILVTFLNLIPAAQLDGGHIARAFMKRKLHHYLTIALGLAMLALSYLWVAWSIWGILILLLGMAGNPGALDEVTPISKKRLLFALIAVIIFILSATPVPIKAG
ncbi:site-2 protease family protein [Thermococcus sp.]